MFNGVGIVKRPLLKTHNVVILKIEFSNWVVIFPSMEQIIGERITQGDTTLMIISSMKADTNRIFSVISAEVTIGVKVVVGDGVCGTTFRGTGDLDDDGVR